MRPKDTKQAIEQLIGDIQDNEWYCSQGDFEIGLEFWEKNLIVIGLRKLLLDADFGGECGMITRCKYLSTVKNITHCSYREDAKRRSVENEKWIELHGKYILTEYVEPDCPDDALRNEKGQNACWIVEVEELKEETEQYKAVATSEEVNESLCKLCANVRCYYNERNVMMLECTEYIPPKGEQ